MKRMMIAAFSAALLLPLVACAQTVYVTTTDYQVATVTVPKTELTTSTVISTVTSPPLTSTATVTLTAPTVTTTYTVTAPTVTTTVTAPPVTTTTATSTPPPVGILTANFNGTGNLTTGIFSISPASSTWWIYYSVQLADPSNPAMSFTFSVWRYPQGSQYIKSVTAQQPGSSQVFIIGQSGMFFIDVSATNATWTLTVYQPT
jgi:hypothetical protein